MGELPYAVIFPVSSIGSESDYVCSHLAKDPENTEALQVYREQYQRKSRDNARTPMQWSAAKHAGFTSPTVTPWMSVNPNHTVINAEAQLSDPNSVFNYWRTVLGLRKRYLDIFVYGDFVMLDSANEQIFAYTRQFADQQALVLCNWTDDTVVWDPATHSVGKVREMLLSSSGISEKYHDRQWPLRPYEAAVLLVEPTS